MIKKLIEIEGMHCEHCKKKVEDTLYSIPEVKEENNISIHQILRLLYIDQESPTGSLFYYEQFDSQSTREAVADLLLGVYNQDLYTHKSDLQNSEKRLEELKREEINTSADDLQDLY